MKKENNNKMMKNSKRLKPFNVMTASIVLTSTLLSGIGFTGETQALASTQSVMSVSPWETTIQMGTNQSIFDGVGTSSLGKHIKDNVIVGIPPSTNPYKDISQSYNLGYNYYGEIVDNYFVAPATGLYTFRIDAYGMMTGDQHLLQVYDSNDQRIVNLANVPTNKLSTDTKEVAVNLQKGAIYSVVKITSIGEKYNYKHYLNVSFKISGEGRNVFNSSIRESKISELSQLIINQNGVLLPLQNRESAEAFSAIVMLDDNIKLSKDKVEGLFKDNHFNSLKDTTNQAAIDAAQNAVNKLPAVSEKDQQQGLVDKAQNLLNQQIQADKDLADAKSKAEGLFTDSNFNKLKGTTNQAAIDAAQSAVNKLPAGTEKTRLQGLVNNAQGLLNQQIQADKDLADAKSKAEGLFTDSNFNKLKGTTNQAAIDAAQSAVNKLPAGTEKTRLQGLVNNAQGLLNQQIQADKDLADAKSKAEGLFTDSNFNKLKGTTNQAAIDAAQNAVNKLPAGTEKTRLQGLVNNAQNLLNQQIQADKDLADAKSK
ncbi:toxin Cry1Ac domain D-VI-related protein, partial [Lysinibacillus cavernae]|uniref:toxin Cry1Ac domain D-VI-related protein n=1 Tax=Lysinibacillus cavernae TaxID=2666135 RepID=UPI001E4F008D